MDVIDAFYQFARLALKSVSVHADEDKKIFQIIFVTSRKEDALALKAAIESVYHVNAHLLNRFIERIYVNANENVVVFTMFMRSAEHVRDLKEMFERITKESNTSYIS